MCYIGEQKRVIQVEPLELPVPLPGQPTPEIEPDYEPVYVEAPQAERPVLVPVR